MSNTDDILMWSWRQKSNPQPTDYKTVALPIELRQHIDGAGTRVRPRNWHILSLGVVRIVKRRAEVIRCCPTLKSGALYNCS